MSQLHADSTGNTLPQPSPELPWRFGVAVVLIAVAASGLVSALVARRTAPHATASTAPAAIPLPKEMSDLLGAPPSTPLSAEQGKGEAGPTSILPAPGFDLRLLAGESITVPAAPLQAKVGARGYWVGTSDTDRIFIRFDEPGVEPPVISVGQRLTLSGRFTPLPENFETKFGIAGPEDRERLRSQGLYLVVTAAKPA